MRQTQIQRKRHARNGPDDTPDDVPTEVTEQSARASRDAADLIAKIERETSNA